MMKKDPNIYLLTADLGWWVLDTLLRDLPEQCINVGIAEQNMIGIAAWLALEWKKVFCYSITPFVIMRPYEQIRVDICSHNLDVTLIGVWWGFAYGALGNTHYGIEDINLMRGLPNMRVFCPADKLEMELGFEHLLKSKWPVYIRLNRWWEENIHTDISTSKIEEWIQMNSGKDILLLSTGRIGCVNKEVSSQLIANGYSVTSVSIPYIKPINQNYIVSLINSHSSIFTLEEHTIIWGLWSSVAEILAEAWIAKKFMRIGINDTFFYIAGDQEYMRKLAGIDAESVYNKIINFIK
jgi:transketolase